MSTLQTWQQFLTDQHAEFGEFRGRQAPLHFGNAAAEYQSLSTACGLVDLTGDTQIELTGKDRVQLLNNLCTNDLKQLRSGQGCEAFMLNVKGQIIGHVFLYFGNESLILHTIPGQSEALLPQIDKYTLREDVVPHDRTDEWAALLLSGPKTPEVFAAVTSTELPTELLAHTTVTLCGVEVQLCQFDWLSESGYVVRCPLNEAETLWSALVTAGAKPVGIQAAETARIERGTPSFGLDIGAKNLAQELDRDDRAISLTKGCYLGQETVARLDALGHVNRLFRGLKFPTAEVPAEGTKLGTEKPVAEVTSATFSPKLGTGLALGFVRRGHHTPGTKIPTDFGDVEVVQLPV